MSYDNEKRLIISKVVSDNPKAPTLRAEVEIGGQKYRCGLWSWERKDGTKVTDKHGNGKYIGTLEIDDYRPNQEPPPATAQPPKQQDDFDTDSIPF